MLAAPWPAGIDLNEAKLGVKLVVLIIIGALLVIRVAALELHDVAKPMRMLSRLAQPGCIRDEFLAGGNHEAKSTPRRD